MNQFTKIKFDGSKVTLKWVAEQSMSTTREVSYVCSDAPHEDFTEALRKMVQHVLHILELPPDYARGEGGGDVLRVTGLSINYEAESGRRGLVVTCMRDLDGTNAPLILNTPHLPEDDGEGEGPAIPTAMLRAMEDICSQADAYIRGHRAQGDLFAGDDMKVTIRAPGMAPIETTGKALDQAAEALGG